MVSATNRDQQMQRQLLTGEEVWHGRDIAGRSDWQFAITDGIWSELKEATRQTVRNGQAWQDISHTNFLAPKTKALCNHVAKFLEHGPGLAKLTGFKLEELTEAERHVLFNGIGYQLGTPVSMSADGMMMSDVTNEGDQSGLKYGQVKDQENNDFLSSRARVHSTAKLRFHNDRCDVVALMCAEKAASGGTSRLVSVPMIHNQMLATRPDLLECLFHNYDRSRLGDEFGDNASWYSMPIFALNQGSFTSHYSRTFIEAAQMNPDVKKMTPAQWQAIDLMHEIADEVAFENDILPGEIQLLNNHVIFHGRTAYEDSPTTRRLLHRLWIAMPNSRSLPESFRILFRDIKPGSIRGGIPRAA